MFQNVTENLSLNPFTTILSIAFGIYAACIFLKDYIKNKTSPKKRKKRLGINWLAAISFLVTLVAVLLAPVKPVHPSALFFLLIILFFFGIMLPSATKVRTL
jgi:hypothetical protein